MKWVMTPGEHCVRGVGKQETLTRNDIAELVDVSYSVAAHWTRDPSFPAPLEKGVWASGPVRLWLVSHTSARTRVLTLSMPVDHAHGTWSFRSVLRDLATDRDLFEYRIELLRLLNKLGRNEKEFARRERRLKFELGLVHGAITARGELPGVTSSTNSVNGVGPLVDGLIGVIGSTEVGDLVVPWVLVVRVDDPRVLGDWLEKRPKTVVFNAAGPVVCDALEALGYVEVDDPFPSWIRRGQLEVVAAG